MRCNRDKNCDCGDIVEYKNPDIYNGLVIDRLVSRSSPRGTN